MGVLLIFWFRDTHSIVQWHSLKRLPCRCPWWALLAFGNALRESDKRHLASSLKIQIILPPRAFLKAVGVFFSWLYTLCPLGVPSFSAPGCGCWRLSAAVSVPSPAALPVCWLRCAYPPAFTTARHGGAFASVIGPSHKKSYVSAFIFNHSVCLPPPL